MYVDWNATAEQTMVNLQLGSTATSPRSQSYGYMQVKPVCYTSDKFREIKSSRDANIAARRDRLTGGVDQWEFLKSSLPYSFYGYRISPPEMANSVGIRLQNISLGTPEDGFFAGSNFLAW
ncbi:unnamed protein product [Dicrocoelium dendriticum]|nr:unnamed protein product [Dicrocoelium dendriticum]